MKYAVLSIAVLTGIMGAPVVAQQTAMPSADQSASVDIGTTIYGSDGTAIGTVARAEGNLIVLDVDGRAVPIPANAVRDGENGPEINITKGAMVTQFDQQMAEFEARLDAALTAGAAVQTADGKALGTIQETNDEAVVVESGNGPVTLPRELLTLDNEGALIVRATMDQIKQAMSSQSGQG